MRKCKNQDEEPFALTNESPKVQAAILDAFEKAGLPRTLDVKSMDKTQQRQAIILSDEIMQLALRTKLTTTMGPSQTVLHGSMTPRHGISVTSLKIRSRSKHLN